MTINFNSLFVAILATVMLASVIEADRLDAENSYWPKLIFKSRSSIRDLFAPSAKASKKSVVNYKIEKGGCNTNYAFDYLMLTLMWGPGFCTTSSRKCIRPAQTFTIHGMWPQLHSGEMKGFCCFDNTFNYPELEPLLPSLNRLWFSYYDENSKTFWAHEWLKHGTCLRDVNKLQGEMRFFGTTLNLMASLPLLETLANDNITPGPGSYQTSSIIQSLKSLTNGTSVIVDCDHEHHQPIPVLTGLNLCFDKNLTFIDCPQSKSRCLDKVYFRK